MYKWHILQLERKYACVMMQLGIFRTSSSGSRFVHLSIRRVNILRTKSSVGENLEYQKECRSIIDY